MSDFGDKTLFAGSYQTRKRNACGNSLPALTALQFETIVLSYYGDGAEEILVSGPYYVPAPDCRRWVVKPAGKVTRYVDSVYRRIQ